jgi:GTP-binding protein
MMKVVDARFVASARAPSEVPPPRFAEVAFAGRSNVGKSSLINRLLGRRNLVRVSNTPGCTRGVNVFRVRLEDAVVDFVDLPGYGYAKRSKKERASWGPLVEGFVRTRDNLRATVVIVDIRRGLQKEEEQLLQFLREAAVPPVVVATKLDKLPRNRRRTELLKLRRGVDYPVIGFSAVSGEGREELMETVLAKCLGGKPGSGT